MEINIEIGNAYEDGARISRIDGRWTVYTGQKATRETIVAVRAALDLLLAVTDDTEE